MNEVQGLHFPSRKMRARGFAREIYSLAINDNLPDWVKCNHRQVADALIAYSEKNPLGPKLNFDGPQWSCFSRGEEFPGSHKRQVIDAFFNKKLSKRWKGYALKDLDTLHNVFGEEMSSSIARKITDRIHGSWYYGLNRNLICSVPINFIPWNDGWRRYHETGSRLLQIGGLKSTISTPLASIDNCNKLVMSSSTDEDLIVRMTRLATSTLAIKYNDNNGLAYSLALDLLASSLVEKYFWKMSRKKGKPVDIYRYRLAHYWLNTLIGLREEGVTMSVPEELVTFDSLEESRLIKSRLQEVTEHILLRFGYTKQTFSGFLASDCFMTIESGSYCYDSSIPKNHPYGYDLYNQDYGHINILKNRL